MTWRILACLTAALLQVCSSSSSSAHAATYKDVLGRTEIESIVKAEVNVVEKISVRDDFIEWSIATIEPMASPVRREDSHALLTRGYHAFVAGVVAFAKRQNMEFVDLETGRQFLKENTDCGPIPCDEDVCCDFCQSSC